MRRFLAVSVLCSTAALLALPVWSQDKKEGEGKPPAMPEMSAEDKAWMEAAMPGENHKLLEHFVGNWDVSQKFWMDEQVGEGKGRATMSAMLGGRYIGDHYTGDFMGMPFEGHGVTGYDNVKKKFVSGWVDNMGTGIMMQEGVYDAAKKEFTYTGEFPSPMGGMIKNRMVITINAPDKHTMVFYHTEKDGPEKKVMELVYTRAAGGAAPAGGGK